MDQQFIQLTSNVLESIPGFGLFQKAELNQVSALMEIVKLDQDEDVFQEGQGATVDNQYSLKDYSVYVILTGEISVYKESPHGRQLLSVMSPGSIFGEMSFIDCHPRSATCTAAVPSVVAALSRHRLVELEQTDIQLASRLIIAFARAITRKMRFTLEHLLFSMEMLKKMDL